MLFNSIEIPYIITGNQRDRLTFVADTSGPADTVDIAVFFHGDIVVDDKTQVIDMDTSGRNVRCDNDLRFALLELLNGAHSAGLSVSSMEAPISYPFL